MSIYKKQSDDLKSFETPEEFLKYYDNNKKDIDETHTKSLNLKFKINGHKIGRKQGKIILYPLKKEAQCASEETEQTEQIKLLREAIVNLNERLKKLEQAEQQRCSTQSSNPLSYYHK